MLLNVALLKELFGESIKGYAVDNFLDMSINNRLPGI